MSRHGVFLALVFAVASAAALARPVRAEGLTALYAAYWAGVPAGTVRLSLDDGGAAYRDRIEIRTVGLPWLFTHFRTTATATGELAANRLADPAHYDALYDLHSRRNARISMRFVEHDGAVVAVRGPRDGSHEKLLAEAFRRNVVDPLSALERIREALAAARRTRPASFRVPVYDGKRRFDILGRVLPQPRSSKGVVEVALTLLPIAGFKGMKDGKSERDAAPASMLLRVTDDGRLLPLSISASAYFLPLYVVLQRACAAPAPCAE